MTPDYRVVAAVLVILGHITPEEADALEMNPPTQDGMSNSASTLAQCVTDAINNIRGGI